MFVKYMGSLDLMPSYTQHSNIILWGKTAEDIVFIRKNGANTSKACFILLVESWQSNNCFMYIQVWCHWALSNPPAMFEVDQTSGSRTGRVCLDLLFGLLSFCFGQIDTGERRTSLTLQGLGAKLGGCGTFQVRWLLSTSSWSYS